MSAYTLGEIADELDNLNMIDYAERLRAEEATLLAMAERLNEAAHWIGANAGYFGVVGDDPEKMANAFRDHHAE